MLCRAWYQRPAWFYRGITDSLHRCSFFWAWLARLGRGHGLLAATIVPPSTSSQLPCFIFTMDSEGVRCRYRTLAIVLGPWSNRDAVTNAAILDLQLTAFWRHLCGDAFRRQSRISDLLRSAVAGIHRRLSTVEISESLSRMSLDRRFPSVWVLHKRRATRTPQRMGTCPSSGCTVGPPLGGVVGFQR